MRSLLCVLALIAPGLAQQEFQAGYRAAEELRATEGASPAAIQEAYRRALSAFERLPEGVRQDPGWLPSGAFCAWQAAEFDRAAELFDRSMAAGNHDSFHASYLLRSLLAAGHPERFLRRARALEADFTADVSGVLIGEGGLNRARAWLVGERWLRAGASDDGLWVFASLARASEDHPDALANLALSQRHVGREEEAEATYRRAIDQAPSDPALWNDLGLLYKGAGRLDDALRALQKSRSLEDAPRSGAATTNLIYIGLRTDVETVSDPAQALQVLLRARPDAGLARRGYLMILARTRFPTSDPDTGPRHR